MENSIFEQERYERAKRRVARIRRFYIHAIVYVVVNVLIAILNMQNLQIGETYFVWDNLGTPIFWGIGLLAHGLSVFLPSLLIGKDWEERKIKALLEEEKQHKWE